ncbi:MAG: CRTAC1 family protein [Acidobacteriota bacterium]
MRVLLAAAALLVYAGPLPQEPSQILLVPVDDRAGISFQHELGEGGLHIAESPGSGGAWIDYDVDGDLDLVLVNGLPARDSDPADGKGHALFRNGGGRFARAPHHVGIEDRVWGGGAAVGDFDNDGFPDVLITALGADHLYRNNGDGTFSATPAGVEDGGWGTSAAFTDWDHDGFLDLYVARYLAITLTSPRKLCFDQRVEVFCGPDGREGEADLFYRNDGVGGFERWYVDQIDPAKNPGFAVVATDCDGDMLPEIYVANDGRVNLLFRRDADGTPQDDALFSGTGYSGDGRAQAGMSATAGDVDGDGVFDLFVTNFQNDHNTLYHNLGDCVFEDTTADYGLAASSLAYMGWGAQLVDLDGDADEDLVIANGHIYRELASAGTARYEQPSSLYVNRLRETGEPGFVEQSQAIPMMASSRALLKGDYDNDGDADLLITNLNRQPTLLRNDGTAQFPTLRLTLIGRTSNRSAYGARIRVLSGGITQLMELRGTEGYMASNDTRVLVHLPGGVADEVEITWPGGGSTLLRDQLPAWLVIDEAHGVIARR